MAHNDNPAPERYEIRQGKTVREGEVYWYVVRAGTPRKVGNQKRISERFPTYAQAERCRDVLLADDRRRA